MAEYYHACTPKAWESILADGMVRKSWDGCVYLCKAPDEAARFVALRLLGTGERDITVLEFDGLEESKIEEVFDHNEAFWKCRCWGYFDDIPVSGVSGVYDYEIGGADGQ